MSDPVFWKLPAVMWPWALLVMLVVALGEAVVVLDHLPADRQSAAMIKVGDRVFTAAEVDRLHHRKASAAPLI